MKPLQITTMLLGSVLALGGTLLYYQNEIAGFEGTLVAGLWIGAFSASLKDAEPTIQGVATALLTSLAGFLALVLFFAVPATLFAAVILLLSLSSFTEFLAHMKGMLATVLIVPILPFVFGGVGWLAARSLGWLGDAKDDWIAGFVGTLSAMMPLLFVFFLGALPILTFEWLSGIILPQTFFLVYVPLCGALHGYLVPGAISFVFND